MKHRVGGAIQQLRDVLSARDSAEQSDADLIRRFAGTSDAAAFEAIVRRHGPMVLGVCRRLLHHGADADDAFQATFAILVRKAGSLSRPERLAGWLFQVACRTARRAQFNRSRRQALERPLLDAAVESPIAEIVWRELQPIFDEEVARLPEKLRLPVVLCFLEGRTKRAAAQALGWAEGTFSCRLQRARELLRTRLVRRGVTLSAGALHLALFQGAASAAVPKSLISTTVHSASLAAAPSALSGPVAALTQGVIHSMFLTKLKIAAALVLAAGVLGGGASWMAQSGSGRGQAALAGEPAEKKTPVQPAAPNNARPDDPERKVDRTEAVAANDKEPNAEERKALNEKIDRLVAQLGDEAIAKRQQAWRELETIGEPAIDILKKASETAADAEIRDAAGRLLEAIKSKASGLMRIFEHNGRSRPVNGLAISVAISADGKRAVSAFCGSTLRCWNLENGELIREMVTGSAIWSTAMSADGKLALSGSQDGTMRLWDLEKGKELSSFGHEKEWVWDIVFSPDSTKALSASRGGVARLWDLKSGKELVALPTVNPPGADAVAVAFTPDGQFGVSGGSVRSKTEQSLRLWDLKTGKEVREFKGHTSGVKCMAVSPDGKQLLSGSFDGTMRLWDLSTGKELKRFEGDEHSVTAVAFTNDGKRVLCSYGYKPGAAVRLKLDSSCSIRLWDLASGKELKRFEGHAGPILSMAVSADGRFIISGSVDTTMRLWQMPK